MALAAPRTDDLPPNLKRAAHRFVDDIRLDLKRDKLVWPSVPVSVVKIRDIARRSDASADEIARAAATDPALATRFLKVANSVFYGGMTPCRDLHSAVVRLGNSAVEHVVLLFVVAQVYSIGSRRKIQPYLRRLWRHSTTVAALASLLADRSRDLDSDVAMLAGLTHDIGALPVLVRAERVPQLIECRELLDPLVKALHCEVGQAMLQAWRFPTELVSAAAAHEQVSRVGGECPDYVDTVIVANLLSRLPANDHEKARPWLELPAFSKLDIEFDELPALCEGARSKEADLRQI